MTDLTGRVVLLTGASRGIGRAIALAFAHAGATLALSHRDEGTADALTTELHALGATFLLLRSDASKADDIDALFDRTITEFGHIDIVVANAGVELVGPTLLESSIDDIDRVLNLNLRGTILLLRRAAKDLTDGGRIIVTGSTIADYAPPGSTVYAASKAALRPLVLALARELGPRRITVNLLAPGLVEGAGITADLPPDAIARFAALNPMGRSARPDDVGPLAVFLASTLAAFVSGRELTVDGAAMG
ncbi:SDR family NAD(P)-dependent oxidoreductase [Actinoplanes sp. URMC 104]|uniref:SDR family NAD(P)-dependent oxidoreductase n=1 Tax=Actinoplanes sp. URMC 104 TaxID=3423409 RepID=UPI003F1C8B1C